MSDVEEGIGQDSEFFETPSGTTNFKTELAAQLSELIPEVIADGKVDVEKLQELLDDDVADSSERFGLFWPGKKRALRAAQEPTTATLKPDVENSKDWDTTKNVFIEGDNLEVLKILQKHYHGKIKMIYIDPPYNTGNDFIYDDDFSEDIDSFFERSNQKDATGNRLVANSDSKGRFHSDWLSMMYPRLRLARSLLRDDGVMFVSIDDHEVQNLRRLCDEVFGEQNFVATIIWQKVYSPKNSAKWFSEDHDYILVYARHKEQWQPQPLPRTKEMEARYKNPDNDPRGPWKSRDMSARNRYDAGVYSITCPSGRKLEGPPTGRYWVIDEEKFKSYDADNRIWWGSDGNNVPAIKSFLSEVAGGRTPQTLWFYEEVGHTQDAKKTLLKYVPFKHTENVLNSVKPVELIQRMLILAGAHDDESIILDFFGGSASTAHAVIAQNAADGGNRRFISVQIAEPLPKPEPQLDSIFEMGLTRIRNVAKELEQEDSATLVGRDASLDLGFRVLKIDTSNMKDVYYAPDGVKQGDLLEQIENIKEDRTPEDLLFQVLLDWGVDLSLPITGETVEGKTVFFVDESALVACFDKDINEQLVKTLAARQPLRAVFRDSGYGSDSVKINVEQIFKLISPSTEVKSI